MPPRAQELTAGPFRGMRYVRAAKADSSLAYFIANMLPVDRSGRPGALTPMLPSSRQFSGAGDLGTPQAVVGHAGLADDLMIVSGELWYVHGGGRVIAAADLAAAGIVLSAVASRIWTCLFNGQLIVNDGVNQPFAWDGVTAHGGLTKLTNAPARCFGQPTVYYGKLFFIKADPATGAATNVIDWSEENQPNTGYEAGGFNNSWALTQSGQGPVYALCGTNAALYYWRADSVGAIRGAVTPTFQGDGVQDDVSTSVGATVPQAVAAVGETVWFLDRWGRPHVFSPGEAPVSLWAQLSDAYGSVSGDYDGGVGTQFARPGAVVAGADGLVFMEIVGICFLVFEAAARQLLCVYVPPQGMMSENVANTPAIFGALAHSDGPGRYLGMLYDGIASAVDTTLESWPPMGPVDHYVYPPGGIVGPAAILVPEAFRFGTNILAQWREVALRCYVPRSQLGAGQLVQLFVANDLGYEGPEVNGSVRVPASFTQLTAQTATASPTERLTKRLLWGLRRRTRELQLAVSFSVNNGVGVYDVTVRCIPTLAPPKVQTS